MKFKAIILIASLLAISACKSDKPYDPVIWDDTLDPYMAEFGYTDQKVEGGYQDRDIYKNGILIWQFRWGGRSSNYFFMGPTELEDNALADFYKAYDAAKDSYVQDFAEKSGIPVDDIYRDNGIKTLAKP